MGSTQIGMLVAHQITTLKATVWEALLKDLHTIMSTSVLSFSNANGKNKQTVYFNPYIMLKRRKTSKKSKKKFNVNFSVMWPVSFIGKYLPQFFLCLIAGECHRSVNISTCWGYIPQDWRINAFACPRGGGAGEASVLNSVHYMSRLHIFFYNKSRLHTLQSSCVAMGTDTRCKKYFSLSYLVKFALYISLHAMWMYCNIRIGTGGKRMLVTAFTSIQDGARRIRSELSGLISRRIGLKMVNFYE